MLIEAHEILEESRKNCKSDFWKCLFDSCVSSRKNLDEFPNSPPETRKEFQFQKEILKKIYYNATATNEYGKHFE